jgi:hypothetical protein
VCRILPTWSRILAFGIKKKLGIPILLKYRYQCEMVMNRFMNTGIDIYVWPGGSSHAQRQNDKYSYMIDVLDDASNAELPHQLPFSSWPKKRSE